MLDLALGLTTCRRPEGACYLGRSLLDLWRTGLLDQDHPLQVFTEPMHDLDRVLLPQCPWLIRHVAPYPLGCFSNWKRALTFLVEQTTAAWLMVVQDDVVYRSDLLSRLHAGMTSHPEVGALSPYGSVAMFDPAVRLSDPAWVPARYFNNAFWGALALCFPRASAQALLAFPRFRNHDHHRKIDVVVGNCLRDLGLSLLVHCPSLCDHIGARSTLGRDRIKGIAWGRRGLDWRPDP